MEKIKRLKIKRKPLSKAHRKYFELYDFQKLGLFLAQNLKDEDRLSFYIKLAKYEDRDLLMNAYSYAKLTNTSNYAQIFLWRLQELKKSTTYRLFVGLNFTPESVKTIKNFVKRELSDTKPCVKVAKAEDLHMTLYFNSEFPGKYFAKLSQVVSKAQEKYGEEIVITASKLKTFIRETSGYIWLTNFNSQTYRYFHGLRKIFTQDKQLKSLESTFPKRFMPHITLARFNAPICKIKEIDTNVDLLLTVKFKLVVTYKKTMLLK